MIYIRNKKNTTEEFYRIIGLLTILGGETVENGMDFKNSNEFFYIDYDSYKEMPLIRSVDARHLKYGQIFTVDEFLEKYETSSKILVDIICGREMYPSELLCTVIKEVQCRETGAEDPQQKVFYGILQDNRFSLLEADETELKILVKSKEK